MSKTIKIDHSGVKKLDGSKNFPLWKLTLENIFWASGIEGVIFGTEIRHASDTDLQRQWDVKNRAGMGIILQTLEEKLTSYVFTCASANAMWKVLEQTFGKSNKWTKQELLQEFYQATLDDKTPTELVNTLQTIGGQLGAMGYHSIDEDAILGKVLHELKGPKYDSFVESWDVVPNKDKKIMNLVQKLKVHESRHELWNKSEAAEKAFSTLSGVKPGGSGNKNQHNQTEGRTQSNSKNGNGKKFGKCYNCGKKGHYKADCTSPLKKKKESDSVEENRSEGKNETASKRSFSTKEGSEKAFNGNLKAHSHKTKVEAEIPRDNFVWYCDSGTNVHVSGRRDWFTSYEEFEVPKQLQVATNCLADCPGKGTVTVQAFIYNKWETVKITEVLYLPDGANLFSVNRMLKQGYSAKSTSQGTVFYDRNGDSSLQAKLDDDNMQVMVFKPVNKLPKAYLSSGTMSTQRRWHERLGHVNFKYLKNSVDSKAVYLGPRDVIEKEYKCDVCIKAKAHLKPYFSQSERHYEVGELLHTDLVHAVSNSNQGNKYFLLVKDNTSNYRVAYFQKTKEAEVTVANLVDVINMISKQTGRGVKRLKSDKGTEFRNSALRSIISGEGMIHELTPAGCSSSNGKIERDVRTVRNMARALLLEVGLPPAFWQDAVSTAIYTLNRLLSSTNKEMTPYEMLFHRKPNLAHAKIFGCAASARILDPKGVWTTRTREGIFVGHIPETKEIIK